MVHVGMHIGFKHRSSWVRFPLGVQIATGVALLTQNYNNYENS